VPCPECGKPLALAGRFCKSCGWDADLEESEDGYLDGVDVPEGYPPEEDGEARPRGRRVIFVLAAIAALVSFVYVFVL
jgi:hypothetical protein